MNEIEKIKIILLYHEVSDDITESGFQNRDNLLYIHKVKDFERDLEIVKNHIQKTDEEVIFTFDDGGISNLRSAEMLSREQMKGYFFITTSKIGQKGFLASDDICKVADYGHNIGSHSHTHPMIFKSLSYKQMLNEWKTSKEILEQILSREITSCSIPGGDSDKKTYESACEAGFTQIFDSETIVTLRKMNNSEILGRLSIKNNVTGEELKKILSLENLSKLQRIRKFKKIIKTLIFPLHQYLQNKKNEVSY